MIVCHPGFEEKSQSEFVESASVEPLSAILPRLLAERGLAGATQSAPPVVAQYNLDEPHPVPPPAWSSVPC